MFCSMKCAAHITLELFEGTDDWSWCPACKSWVIAHTANNDRQNTLQGQRTNESPDCVDNEEPYRVYHHSYTAWTPESGRCYGKPISLSEYVD